MTAEPAPVELVWTVRTVWAPLTGQDTGDVTTETHPSLSDAVAQGRSLSCCAGARVVEVTHPDGTLAASWVRANGSRWISEPAPT